MAKAGIKGYIPLINVAPAPTDAKRVGALYVNDVVSTLNLLNTQIGKCAKVGIAVELKLEVDAEGATHVNLVSATRA